MMHPSLSTTLLALVACSDYSLKGKANPGSATEVTDSGDPEGTNGSDTKPSDTDTGEEPPPPPAEECNGLDDNDDGVVDEGFPDTDGDGVADCMDNECEPLRSELSVPEADSSCAATVPRPSSFDLEEVWSWEAPATDPEYGHVFSQPIIVSLNDDNGDGWVDQDDIPDVVVAHGPTKDYWTPGMITALSGDGSGELWSYSDNIISSSTGLAAGDIDGDGLPEIGIHAGWGGTGWPPQQVTVLNADGSLKWTASYSTSRDLDTELSYVGHPLIADVDGDGRGNLLGSDRCWNWVGAECGQYDILPLAAITPTAMDLDGDGEMELLLDGYARRMDGTLYWEMDRFSDEGDASSYSMVVDLDADGAADVIWAGEGGIDRYTANGDLVWQNRRDAIEALGIYPEFSQPASGVLFGDGGRGIVVRDDLGGLTAWDALGVLRCSMPAMIEEGAGGWATWLSAPILYRPFEGMADVVIIRNYLLDDGAVIDLAACEQVGIIPGLGLDDELVLGGVLADVDLDGQPEVVFGFSGHLSTSRKGIAVYRPVEPWAPARRIWNQAQYHQTNINDDGSIPSPETPVWEANNSWREQAWFADWPNLPNLRPLAVDLCFECEGDELGLTIQVGNAGAGRALARIPVSIYAQAEDSSRTLQGIGYLTTELGAGESAYVDVTMPTSAWPEGSSLVIVVDDNGDGSDRRDECDESDNEWLLSDRPCAD